MTDCLEGDCKVNHNSPSDQTEGANFLSTETNLSPHREEVGYINWQNKNSSSSMTLEVDNDNDEYYVLIQTILVRIIVRSNIFGQATAISIGLLTCQWNAFLQTLRTGSIEN